MAAQHHVFGPCFAYTFIGPSLGTLSLFGCSTDGMQVEIIDYVEKIHDDRGGPSISTDEQRFGSEARITGEMVFYDETVRATLFAQAQSGGTLAEGLMGYAGVLFGLGGYYYSLVLNSPSGSSPTSESLWNFPYARLLDAQAVKLGTVKNIWRVTFHAVNYLGSNTSLASSVLYKHVYP